MNTSPEQIINLTLSGIAFYGIDMNLSNVLTQQYRIGHIIQHPMTLWMSEEFGGLTTDTRFVIASAHAQKSTEYTYNIHENAYFKVLDILFINQRTQILLLHLPAEAVDIFTQQDIPFEGKLLETNRQIFVEHTYQPPIKALQTEDWLNKTSMPVGMNEAGELHYKFEPPQVAVVREKKVNQFKAGANREEKPKKSFWKRWLGR